MTSDPPIPGNCDKCTSVAGNSGFTDEGAGGVTRNWEIDNKASQENFLFFETKLPFHIVNIDTHLQM